MAPVRAATTVVRQSSFPSFVRAASDLAYNLRLARHAVRRGRRGLVAFVYQRHTAFSVAGYLAARRLGVPLVLEYNASEAWARRHWGNARLVGLIARLERVVVRRAALVLAISQPIADELRGMGVSPRRVALAPNGVDPELFDPDRFSVQADALRASLGIAPTQTVVGFVGTFGPWHGTMVLAQAIPMVVRARSDVRFLVIGEGSGRAAFEKSIGAAGAGSAVVMTGAIPHHAVPEYLAACDILVSPHVPMPNGERFFGSPTKLYEYMAIGRPIVASRLEQLEQVLTHGETALLVPPGDPSTLARAIVELAADPARARALGRAARATARERHTWTLMTATWLPRIGASGLGAAHDRPGAASVSETV
jgi:glycosyltransferase involved in cell wall biosynthesis